MSREGKPASASRRPRAETPLLRPERQWEKVGQVPNIIFVEGLVRDGNRRLFYYNGGDKHIGVAEAFSR